MAEKELFVVVFACDNFRSYIIDSKVKVHTDRDGLKEILERIDIKPRMIHWVLLLQEFELQIVQRREEPPEEPNIVAEGETNKRSTTMTIYIPTGTVDSERKLTPFICNSFSTIVQKLTRPRKKRTSLKLEEVNSST
jgi:hypothetical protein